MQERRNSVAYTLELCIYAGTHRYSIATNTNPLHWRHYDHDGASNHQPHGCLLNRFFRCRSKKTSKLRVTGLCVGNSPGPVNSPHKGPVTRKMFPFDDVIMRIVFLRTVGVNKSGPFIDAPRNMFIFLILKDIICPISPQDTRFEMDIDIHTF